MKRSIISAAFLAAFAAAAALAWGSALLGATSAEPSPAPPVTIQAGADFDVPLLVAGKPTMGRGYVNAENVLRVYWAADGRVAGPLLLRIGGDVQPAPTPVPVPVPVPVPTPDEKAVFVYVIHESQTKPPDLKFAAIDNDKGWRDAADRLKIGWRVLDQDNAALKKMPAPLITAKTAGLPAAVFVFPSGASKGEPLKDKTPVDLAELVKRFGGGK